MMTKRHRIIIYDNYNNPLGLSALYFCPMCNNADDRIQRWSCRLGTRNWREHHVREQETTLQE